MPDGNIALVTEQACNRTHEALGVELRDIKNSINKVDKLMTILTGRAWAILGGLVTVLVILVFNLIWR